MNTFVIIAVSSILLAISGLCHGHHGSPLEQLIDDLKKLPKEQREIEFRNLLESRLEAKNLRNAIDDAIIAALEQLRSLMPTGYPELGIPPLDPLYVEHGELNLDHPLITLQLTLDQTTVTKLSGFVIDKIENDLTNLKADFGITVPQIDAEGMYDILGEVTNFLELTGNGSFTLSLIGLSTWGTVTIGSEGGSEDGAVFIQTLELDFSLEAMKTAFENIMGGGELGDLVNNLLTEEGPAYLEQLKPDINEYIASLVTGLANPILSNYSLKQILDFLGVNPN